MLNTYPDNMLPSTKTEVLRHFDSVWAARPEYAIGLAIIEFLSTHIDAKTLPISVFFNAAKQSENGDGSKNSVLAVVNYLSGADLNLLTAEVEFIEDDKIYHLDSVQAYEAAASQINPLTGEYDADLKSKLFICFSPSALAKNTLGS